MQRTMTKTLRELIMCVNKLLVFKVKFLGVLLDANLNFKLHMMKINSFKISKSLYHLWAAKNISSLKPLEPFLIPLFIPSWFKLSISGFPLHLMFYRDLVIKQKMTIRIIHISSYNAQPDSLFKKSSVFPPPFEGFLQIEIYAHCGIILITHVNALQTKTFLEKNSSFLSTFTHLLINSNLLLSLCGWGLSCVSRMVYSSVLVFSSPF